MLTAGSAVLADEAPSSADTEPTDSVPADRPPSERPALAPIAITETADGTIVATLPSGQVIETAPASSIVPPALLDAPKQLTAKEYWQQRDIAGPPSEYEASFRVGVGLPAQPNVDELERDPDAVMRAVESYGARLTRAELSMLDSLMTASRALSDSHAVLTALPGYAGSTVDYTNNRMEILVTPSADLKLVSDTVGEILRSGTVFVINPSARTSFIELDAAALRAEKRRRDGGLIPSWSAVGVNNEANELIFFVAPESAAILGSRIVQRSGGRAVVVELTTEYRAAVDEFSRELDVGYNVQTMAAGRDESCTTITCPQYLRGGNKVKVSGNCSTNFAFKFGSNTGYVGTGGHCTSPDGVTGVGVTYGSVPSSVITHNYHLSPDFALFPWSDWAVGNTLWRSSSATAHKVTSAIGLNAFVSSTFSCLAGFQSSNVYCGQYQARILQDGVWNVYLWSSAGQGGDSGGARYSGSQAHGIHKGKISIGGVNYDLFGQIAEATSACSCSLITRNNYLEQLSNWGFAAGSASSPTNWIRRPGSALGTRMSGGFSSEKELGLKCSGAIGCSWYQDRSLSIKTNKRYGISSYVDCPSSCSVTIAVWGLGGSSGNDVRFLSANVGSGRTYLATTVTFPQAHNTSRFEVYNNSVVGRQIEFSNPMFIEAP